MSKKPQKQNESSTPVWETKLVKVSDLKPFEKNPRRASKEQYERLITSIKKFGYHALILATNDLRIVDGHHRIRALKELGFKEIEARVCVKYLTDEDFLELIIRSNVQYANWDVDQLANLYDADSLIEYGMSEAFLFGKAEEPLPDLASGEKDPFQQMTFTLHDSQAEVVKAAIAEAQKLYPKDPNNENKNGNALFYIAQQFVG